MNTGMPPPDWARYPGMLAPALAPVGDPTRWGATGRVDFRMDQFSLFSEQVIIAAAKDPYPRPWSLIGELSLPSGAWEVPSGYPDPPDPPAGPGGINVLLELVLGVGQIQLTQRILLMSGNDPAMGLCNQQAAVNGGPYGQLPRRMPEFPFASYLSRPFAAIGSIVANTVSVRVVVEQNLTVPPEYTPVFCSLILGPIAAGTQL